MFAVETPSLESQVRRLELVDDSQRTPLSNTLRSTFSTPKVTFGELVWPGPTSVIAAPPELQRDGFGQIVVFLQKFEEAPCSLMASAQTTALADMTQPSLGALEWLTVYRAMVRTFAALAEPAITNPEARMVDDLAKWLRAAKGEIAEMIGTGRTTPYAWSRENRIPRPEVRRKLHQAHALAAAMIQRLGEERGISWLSDESPARRDSFLKGNTIAVQREAHQILFTSARRRPRPGSWIPPEADDDLD
jgi:hypothetical protein